MIARFRRLAALDLIAIAYSVAYFACLGARAAGARVPVVLDVAFYPLGAVVAWASWRNSHFSWLDRRTRIAWRLLAVASAILWMSGSVWTAWISLWGADSYANWIDRVAFAHYAVVIAAIFCFPGRPLPRRSLPRFALDVGLLVVAGFVIAFHIGLRLLLLDPVETMPVAIVESALDWALFVVAAVGCMHKRSRVVRQVLFLLLASKLVSLAGNYLLAIDANYHNGDPVDGLWFAGWVLRWAAARLAWYHYLPADAGARRAAPPEPEYRGNLFSYVLVGGAFLILFVEIFLRNEGDLRMPALAAMGMGVLLVLRQFAQLEENRRLLTTQVERESRFTSLVANASDLVLLIDGIGTVTYVSPSIARVFGEDARLVPGTRLQDLMAPADARSVSILLSRKPTAAPRFESKVQVAPGRWREVEAVWTDLRKDPAVNAIVVNCRDVTERNEIERHLRHAQKLDAMGHLAGGLAHDLNNVLTVIRGYSELLQAELDESSAAAADLGQMVSAVDRATSVTQKVLAFSRKQAGRRSVLDLNDVVRDLDPILRQLVKDHVEVRLTLVPDLWPVLADQGQMEQVMVNLATNARDAMPNGGMIEISTANRVLKGEAADPRGLAPGEYVCVSVRDDGAGMSPAVLPRIFEPFFTTKPTARGLGLGLSIVHRIVSDLDGRLLVDSVEGRGATLTVIVPRARTAAAAAGPAA